MMRKSDTIIESWYNHRIERDFTKLASLVIVAVMHYAG